VLCSARAIRSLSGITIQVLHQFSGRYSYLRLERRDRERRMTRFYTMHLAPTFFGGWDLIDPGVMLRCFCHGVQIRAGGGSFGEPVSHRQFQAVANVIQGDPALYGL